MFPDHWKVFLETHGLLGLSATIEEDDDLSGVGADLLFLSEAQAIDELSNFWPGIGVAADGYVPIAACGVGTGDYYYINRNDGPAGPVYRIHHDEVGPDGYDPDAAVVRVLDAYTRVLGFLDC